MQKIITRFPLLAGFGVFLVASVVLAQVVPEEVIPDVFETNTASSTPENFDSSATSTEEVTETTASSTEEIVSDNTSISSTTDSEIEVGHATSTQETSSSTPLAEEPMMNLDAIIPPAEEAVIAPMLEKEFRSVNDFDKPSECRSASVKLFFENIGECARYVRNKLSEESTPQSEVPAFEVNETGL